MPENGYVTPREFEAAIRRIDDKLDRTESRLDDLCTDFVMLKTKFNDELKDTVKIASVREKWKFALAMAIVSIISSVATAIITAAVI